MDAEREKAGQEIRDAVRALAAEEVARKFVPNGGAARAREVFPEGRAAVFDFTIRVFGKVSRHAGEVAVDALVRTTHEAVEEPQEDSRCQRSEQA